MRTKLPDNLRWFKVDIYIAEIRNLRNTLPTLGIHVGGLGDIGINLGSLGGVLGASRGSLEEGRNQFGDIFSNYGYLKFECHQCEFDFSESFAAGTTVRVDSVDKQNTNKFKIKVGWFTESHSFPNYPVISYKGRFDLTDNFITNLPIIGDAATSLGIKLQDQLNSITGLPNVLINQVATELQSLVEKGSFGDAYKYGYESNGDTIPPGKGPVSNLGDVYP